MGKGEGQEWEKERRGVWTELAMEGTLTRTLVQANGSREPPPQPGTQEGSTLACPAGTSGVQAGPWEKEIAEDV